MPYRLKRDANGRLFVDYSPRPRPCDWSRPQSRPRPTRGPRPEPVFFVGLDLGQAADFTALAVATRDETGFTVPMLERVRGLPYPQLVARVADLLATPPLAGQSRLIVDATGVGRGVVDMVRAAGLDPIALTITAGGKVTGTHRAPHVPKVDLVEGLLVAFQAGAIKIAADLPHAATLVRELAEMRRKISVAGNTSYGVWREGEHDDLVLALAMAVWQADRASPRPAVIRVTRLRLGEA